MHILSSDEGQQDGLLSEQHSDGQRRTPRLRNRPGSVNRLSQLLQPDTQPEESAQLASRNETSRGSAALQRTRSTFRDMLGRRESTHIRTRDISRPTPAFLQHRASYVRTGMNREGADYYPPRLPSMDLTSSFDNDAFASPPDPEPLIRPSTSSNRRSNLRLSSLRPDRSFRHLASLRRRRSPPPALRRIGSAEDQAAMLSRLLSVAAAATAATLVGDDQQALSEARSLTGGTGIGEIGGGGEDGSFDGFLRALQNGRIASALRGSGSGSVGDVEPDTPGGTQGPLNFFRMFRFGASGPSQNGQESNARAGPQSSGDESTQCRWSDGPNHNSRDQIDYTWIRQREFRFGCGGATTVHLMLWAAFHHHFLPMLWAHTAMTALTRYYDHHKNGTSFRHRRRASMGGFGMGMGIGRSRLSDRMDDQRDHRSPDRRRDRPWSMASSSSGLDPRPPPATPASLSPELSRISSRNSTPGHSRPASFVANSMRDFGGDSRRNSALHRASGASPLSSHTEETMSLHSTHSSTNLLSQSQDAEPFRFSSHRRSDTAPNIHYPRFASGHPRRNGVVEPDNLPPLSRSSTSNATDSSSNDRRNSNNDSRSWIIYVLGGSYPENHPILTTPSLFTENPTYEDMMLLSALLGPAKAPVASEEDVESAGGVYSIEPMETNCIPDAAKTALLVAAATESEERIPLELSQKCLVCLCEFEVKEVARKLVKCNHLFHKECIDQVSSSCASI